jgi:hypothetical protein
MLDQNTSIANAFPFISTGIAGVQRIPLIMRSAAEEERAFTSSQDV